MKTKVKHSMIAAAMSAVLLSAPVWAADLVVTPKAKAIAQKHLIVDTHIDAPWRLMHNWEDLTQRAEKGEFDYERAKEGGLSTPFMAIYVPSSYENNGAYRVANNLIDFVESMVYRAPDKFEIPHSVADVKRIHKEGKIALAMGMENGAPIEGDLNKLKHFHERGVRYITLAHDKDNHISDSSYDDRNTWGGLSPFGKELVLEMNRIGMMIDISHVSDLTFFDVMAITKVPVIASHSSTRHFTPGWQRNMSDEMIKELAKNGGVVQVTFGSTFVTEQANVYSAYMRKEREKINLQYGANTPEAKQALEELSKNNPFPYADLNDVLDHIDHVVKLVGIDYVGLGSDFDGVGDSLPTNLKDVSYYPHLVQGLLNRKYTEKQIEKILYGNVLRVWQAVEDYATKQK